MDQLELFGYVSNVLKSANVNAPKEFSVVDKEGNRYRCICPFFCPVQSDDVIYAVCESSEQSNQLIIIRPPFVQLPNSEESIIKSIVMLSKLGYKQSRELYNKIAKEQDVAIYLSKLAEKWMNTRNPRYLDSLNMTKKEAGHFLAKWFKQRNYRRLYLMGLTRKEILACEMNTESIYQRCIENPTTLYGFDLKKAVEIMYLNNRQPTQDDIICGQILRSVYNSSKERGWSGVPSTTILKLYPNYPKYKSMLESKYGLIGEYHTVALSEYAKIEQYVAQVLIELLADKKPLTVEPYYGDKIRLENGSLLKLNEEQKQAVKMSLSCGVSIITGGPGTGKSTIITVICDNLDLLKLKYLLCSFTGAAVANLKEITGREAYTIHQLINHLNKSDEAGFDMIIIDEYSMVTTPLFYELMKTLKSIEHAWPKVLFIGDIDQLPAIEWGDLALEITPLEIIPKISLLKNERVYATFPGETDGILANLAIIAQRSKEVREGIYKKPTSQISYSIMADEYEDMDPDEYEDIVSKPISPLKEASNFFISSGDITVVYDIISDMYRNGYNQNDITIISPYKACLPEINEKFEEVYHGNDALVVDHWNNKWHIGSRIMCLENNYDLHIYNGTEGLVEGFNDEVLKFKVNELKRIGNKVIKQSRVFDIPLKPQRNKSIMDKDTGEYIETEEFNTKKFTLSYAVTTHKAQGRQSNLIIYYIPHKNNKSFIHRNQTYTAISRARRCVWVLGDIDAFYQSLDKGLPYRHNTLAKRFKTLYK